MKTIQLEMINDQDPYEVVLKNAKGDTFSFNPFEQEEFQDFLSGCKLASDGDLACARLSLPDDKEIDEAAESFGDLYSLDGQFANGCESGWKAGAEWMRDKVNEQLGNEA